MNRRMQKAMLLGKKPKPVQREPKPVRINWHYGMSPLRDLYVTWATMETMRKKMEEAILISFCLSARLVAPIDLSR